MQKPLDPNVAPGQEQPVARWVEPVAALLMAFATLSTAWCSYESAAWTRKANGLSNQADGLERTAGLLRLEGNQVATIHISLFMQVLTVRQAGNEKLADFYVARFPPELRKAYDAWMAQKPFENPNADPHPFIPTLYEMRGSREADEANAKALADLEKARQAGNTSGQYLANTVLFAAVLFFANAAAKFAQRRVRTTAFIFAIVVFVFAVMRTITLPR